LQTEGKRAFAAMRADEEVESWIADHNHDQAARFTPGGFSSRACTHKSRLFGNRWLMSALPAKVAK
jgi:hypothetical protein